MFAAVWAPMRTLCVSLLPLSTMFCMQRGSSQAHAPELSSDADVHRDRHDRAGGNDGRCDDYKEILPSIWSPQVRRAATIGRVRTPKQPREQAQLWTRDVCTSRCARLVQSVDCHSVASAQFRSPSFGNACEQRQCSLLACPEWRDLFPR
jgi:hypothetical protein